MLYLPVVFVQQLLSETDSTSEQSLEFLGTTLTSESTDHSLLHCTTVSMPHILQQKLVCDRAPHAANVERQRVPSVSSTSYQLYCTALDLRNINIKGLQSGRWVRIVYVINTR